MTRRPVVVAALSMAAAWVLVAGVATPGLATPGAGAPPAPERFDPGHVLVRFIPGTDAAGRAAAHRRAGATVANRLAPEEVDVVRLGPDDSVEAVLARYRRDPRVLFAEPNRIGFAGAAPDDPYFGGRGGYVATRLRVGPEGSGPTTFVEEGRNDLWGLHNVGQQGGTADADIDAPEGWAVMGAAGSPWPAAQLTVGVIDSGIYSAHEDLVGKAVQPCWNAILGNGTIATGCEDDNGHGTHVSGTIAATANNQKGVVGVAYNARIAMCKALNTTNSGTSADFAACINQLVDQRKALGLSVISMSIVADADETLHLATEYAWKNGVLIVACAGNTGDGTLTYPAAYDHVVSVAATDRTDAHWTSSTANDDVELSAPGVGILSTVPVVEVDGGPAAFISTPTLFGVVPVKSGYATLSGCSMATPHAAAAAALISWRTGKTGAALTAALDRAVDDLGPKGRDPQFGFGRLNLAKALAAR